MATPIDLKTLSNGLDEIPPENLIELAEDKARAFKADRLKTNQLRNFYSAVLQIRQEFEVSKKFTPKIKTMLVLLKPKLAFAAGRQLAVRKNFKPFMDSAIEGVINATNQTEGLENYLALIESVVAYHKFYE